MTSLEIAKLNNSKYKYLILFTSNIESIMDVEGVSSCLRKNNCLPGELLFDLLLVNGNAFNRFVEAYYDGEKLDPKTYNIVDVVDSSITNRAKTFFRNNSKFLNNSILTMPEKRKIMP